MDYESKNIFVMLNYTFVAIINGIKKYPDDKLLT